MPDGAALKGTIMRNRIGGLALCLSMLAFSLGGFGAPGPADDYFTVLHDFTTANYPTYNQDGRTPWHGVIVGVDGNLYGTATSGGPNNMGTVFRVAPATQQFTVLHAFDHQDGALPGALAQAPNGNLYGVTSSGGANNGGTAYVITPDGTYTILHNFMAPGGSAENPNTITVGSDGYLYGTTASGGNYFTGSIFQLSPAGAYTLLYSFTPRDANGNNSDGSVPNTLILGRDGNLYGLGAYGGTSGVGTVFRFSPQTSQFTTLHSFNRTDGVEPLALVETSQTGSFYGVTVGDGGSGPKPGGGTLFSITSSGAFSVNYIFPNSGTLPRAPTGLALDSGGTIYGISEQGGSFLQGSIFVIYLAAGMILPLHSFPAAPTGTNVGGIAPYGTLSIDSQGVLYGTAPQGGQFGGGTVYSYRTFQPAVPHGAAPQPASTPTH
jgi:uncharacterized repeat protein (TIGR03803 family)